MPRATNSFLAVVLASAVLLAGCGSSSAPPAAGKEILVLGVMGMINPKDPSVSGMVQGVQLAVGQYNANNDSRYEIQLKQLNSKPAPGEAGATEGEITRTERLIGVVGPFSLQEVSDLGPVFEGAEMPFLVPRVSDTSLPEPGWRSFRRLIASDSREGEVLAGHAARVARSTIALVAEKSGPGEAFAEGARAGLDRLKRPLARQESVGSRQSLTALGASLTQANPQAILYGGGADTGKALLDALRKAGFKGVLIASHQLRDSNPKGLGGGVVSASPASDPSDPAELTFAETFKKEFGSDPLPFALESYEGAQMLMEAIEEVEGKPRDITEFFQLNHSFRGDSKTYDFNSAGELVSAPVWIYESTDGFWKLSGRSDQVDRQK